MKILEKRDFLWFPLFLIAILSSLALGASRELEWVWIQELRLPRTILAFAIGAALSISGAVLQALFKNPLCEPYTLGVSSGAALGAVIGSTFGVNALFFGFSPSALIGAGIFSGILLLASRSRYLSTSTLLLVGVMLSFLGSSLLAVWMALADPAGVQAAVSWLLGDISRADTMNSILGLIVVGIVFFILLVDHRSLDALLLGEEEAISIGVNLGRFRVKAIIWTSLLVSLAVSLSGMIGFIGLIVPQLVRRTGSSLHLRVLPLCALIGGTFVVLADTIARTGVAPYELPVGVVTAIVGAPFFIYLILQKKRST